MYIHIMTGTGGGKRNKKKINEKQQLNDVAVLPPLKGEVSLVAARRVLINEVAKGNQRSENCRPLSEPRTFPECDCFQLAL